jgi:hypothetical protein
MAFTNHGIKRGRQHRPGLDPGIRMMLYGNKYMRLSYLIDQEYGMEKGKIIKMPGRHAAARVDRDGLSVDCELTYRWLRFSDTYTDSQNRQVAFVDVMTTNIDGADKKICGLAVSIDELLSVIHKIQNDQIRN